MILSQNQRGFKCKVELNGIYKNSFFLANKTRICYHDDDHEIIAKTIDLLEKEDK